MLPYQSLSTEAMSSPAKTIYFFPESVDPNKTNAKCKHADRGGCFKRLSRIYYVIESEDGPIKGAMMGGNLGKRFGFVNKEIEDHFTDRNRTSQMQRTCSPSAVTNFACLKYLYTRDDEYKPSIPEISVWDAEKNEFNTPVEACKL